MKQDWNRKLSKPLGRFRTLRDISDFVLHEFPDGLPPAWEVVAEEAIAASHTGNTVAVEAALARVVAIDPRARG